MTLYDFPVSLCLRFFFGKQRSMGRRILRFLPTLKFYGFKGREDCLCLKVWEVEAWGDQVPPETPLLESRWP